MGIIWKTAWKNVWRSKVRSLVVIASVTVGIFAGVFAVAFMNGMIAQRFDAAIDQEISHIQITGKDYILNNDPAIVITDEPGLTGSIAGIDGVESLVTRTIITGMAGTASKNAGVQIIGIKPEYEKKIFSLYKTIIPGTGDYFERETRYEVALVGEDLARELNIIRFIIDSASIERFRAARIPEEIILKLMPLKGQRFPNEKKFISSVSRQLDGHEMKEYGRSVRKQAWSFRQNSRMTLTFLDASGNQVSSLFRIAGIYDIKNAEFEMSQVFIRNEVLCRLAGIDSSSFHQVIVRISDIDLTAAVTGKIRESFPSLDVRNWKELQPDLAMMIDYVHQIYGIFMFIILAALAFGIINTMLMAVLERTRELGMLAAIGMNKRKIFTMIMLESVFLSLVGGVAGMIVGWLTVQLSARNGINFEQYAEGMEAFGYSAHIYPEMTAGFYLLVTVMIILTGVASSIYPALKALKLDPADAIRTE